MSRQPLAVVAADLHLKRSAWVSAPGIKFDSYFGLEQIDRVVADAGFVPLILAGDLLDDSHPDSLTVKKITEFMPGTQTWYTQGQHDLVPPGDPPWFGFAPDSRHAHGCSFHLGPFRVYGLDYTRQEDLPAALASIPADTDILIMHQVWTDFMGERIGGQLSFADVPHARMLITGDYHKHRVVQAIGASGQALTVLSPGSTCMQSIDEPEDKSVFILHDDLTVESRPILSRRVLRYMIQGPAELEVVARELTSRPLLDDRPEIPEELRRPIISVRYPQGLADVHARMTRTVGETGFLFLRPFGRKETRAVVTRKSFDVCGSLVSGLDEIELDDHDRSVARALLTSAGDPAAELVAQEERYFTARQQERRD